jgi:hypothetical protein
MKMTFNRVVQLIGEERSKQDVKWGSPDDHPHEVGGWILIMEEYIARARAAWSSNRSDNKALSEVRKVTALGFACMQQHGSDAPAAEDIDVRRRNDADFVQRARELAESSEENYAKGIGHFLSMGHKQVNKLHAELEETRKGQ